MKYLVIVCLALLLGVTVWLTLRQQRLERNLRALQGENVLLAQELAQRPNLSAEEFRVVTRRLENAGAFIDAVEGRLTNASALLVQLQAASQNFTESSRQRAAPGLGSPGQRRPDFPSPVSSQSVSSHGPDGQLLQRNWGPEQVVGPPDTHAAGDIPTAWAPLSSQGGPDEWLQVNYDHAVDISEIRVRETHNPGAIAKLAALMADGQEVVIWEGATPPAEPPTDTGFAAPVGLHARSVKIYLDRTRAPGWNEIDAVELIARDGTRQWANSATASTSYADQSRR